jgi:hypothetical protein
MTEWEAQNIVADLVRQPRDLAIVPNCQALGHEADLLRLTEKLVVHEYEIKLSRSAFLADARKYTRTKMWHPDLYGRHAALRVPHHFWYAVLTGVATADDLPEYAGLIVIDGSTARVERRSTRLHDEPAQDRVVRYLHRGLTIRYWQERDGVNPARDRREAQRAEQREWRRLYRERERQRRERYDTETT